MATAKEAKKESTAKEAKRESKFAEFLTAKKLDGRRILIASRKLEALRPEDRLIKLKKRLARARADASSQEAPKETRKPRSGRPVTQRALNAALAGREVSGPTKTRLLHAVNHILGQKKQALADLRSLF
jgi:hypothetical protein